MYITATCSGLGTILRSRCNLVPWRELINYSVLFNHVEVVLNAGQFNANVVPATTGRLHTN